MMSLGACAPRHDPKKPSGSERSAKLNRIIKITNKRVLKIGKKLL